MFSPEIITLFKKTKNIFDPLHVLNPGKKVFADKDFAWNHVDKEDRPKEVEKKTKIVYVEKPKVKLEEIKIEDGREESA